MTVHLVECSLLITLRTVYLALLFIFDMRRSKYDTNEEKGGHERNKQENWLTNGFRCCCQDFHLHLHGNRSKGTA